jgi:hypothetical protein
MSNALAKLPARRPALAAVAWLALVASAVAADKPALAPDAVPPFSTQSRVSATVEFALPALAADIQRDIPRRLASIDERVRCVHRRVLFFRVNANCDIWGHVDRTSPVSISGRGDRLYGAMSIYGVVEGQGANRFTRRIHGGTEARATVEVEARPRLTRDWSVDLNLTDGFHWNEAPVLHVLGRDIAIAKYAEPAIRSQLARVRERAAVAARRLDLRAKAATAWREAFEPVQLSDNPEVWLQLTPQSAAFAGVGANARVLWGALEFTGTAQTVVGAHPSAVTPTPLPPLGGDVQAPGSFDVILPVHIAYDLIRDQIAKALPPEANVREVQVYPSVGKLVVGLRVAKAGDDAGDWLYLSGALDVDPAKQTAKLSDLAGVDANPAVASVLDPLLAPLRDKISLDYAADYKRLLDAASQKLNRPLKDGFRMAGELTSAKLEKVYLPADGVVIAIRASGGLKIFYGL